MRWDDRIGRRIKLSDLHILLVVADAGSMAKAATSLAISQPAISYAIAGMEHALGVPLLDRGPQGVNPTAYGRALIERSVAVFNELRLGVSEIEFLADPSGGELRIGTTQVMSAIASAVINRLMPRYPRMVFHLITESTTVLIRELRRRNIELAICRIAGPFTEDDLIAEILFHDRLAVISGKLGRWVRRRAIRLSELIDEPWVLPPPDSFLGGLICDAFHIHGLERPRATVNTNSTYAINMLVATGPFLTIHPETMLKVPEKHQSLTALAVDLRTTRNPVALIMPKHHAPSPVAKLFTETARDVARALNKAAVSL